MALILSGSWMEQADALLEECANTSVSTSAGTTKGFTVTGRVEALPSDSLRLYQRAFGYYSLSDPLSDEEEARILPLYLSPSDYSVKLIPLLLGLICLGGILVLLVLVFTGWYQRQVRQQLDRIFGDNEEAANTLIGTLLAAKFSSYLYMNGAYLLSRQGASHLLYESGDLLWAYTHVTRLRLYGLIPCGKRYSLVLRLTGGKKLEIPSTKKGAESLMEKLGSVCPGCALDYSDQLASLYSRDPNALRQIAAAQRGF